MYSTAFISGKWLYLEDICLCEQERYFLKGNCGLQIFITSPLIFLNSWALYTVFLRQFLARCKWSLLMSLLRLHRLSVIWKNWVFNQECEHVFQVENSKDNEDSILQREIPARQSRRRFRKINYKGERQTITDDVDINSYLSVSIFRNMSWIFL